MVTKKMQNEPNFKNTKKSVGSFSTVTYANSHTLGHQKNEPNLCKTNPILSTIRSIYAIGCSLDGKYLGVLCALGGYKQKISNEPNLRAIKGNFDFSLDIFYAFC